MPQQPSTDSKGANAPNHRHLNADLPTIKILLYTDDPNEITEGDEEYLGLGLMLEHLEGHQPAFARISYQWVCRSFASHADNKLDDVLRAGLNGTGEPFDEIWFFGLHQVNTEGASSILSPGGPESELTEAEVSALENWMAVNGSDGAVGGGVLMTGDHSNPRPSGLLSSQHSRCPDTSAGHEFLGLGRAVGRCVPRAGSLRTWEGVPTNRPDDKNNTIGGSGFQTDATPQQLILRNVNAEGDPDPDGQPHPLFFYRQGTRIEFFPDHEHEGEIIIPEEFDENVWPNDNAGQPLLPHVVAKGINRRTSELLNLVAAYNGDRAEAGREVGRIVADSTWHHYANLNLENLRYPAPEGSPADQIGQYYGNLAVWLSPRRVRHEMGLAMLWRLAHYTMLLENVGDQLSVGAAAFAVLSQVASPCEAHELIQAIIPQRYGALDFSNRSLVPSHLPSKELLLGSILDSYHEEMIRAERAGKSYKPVGVEEIIDSGFKKAFKTQAELLKVSAADAQRLAGLNRNEKEQTMSSVSTNIEWTIDVKADKGTPPEKRLIFRLTDNGSGLTGEVFDTAGKKLSDVTGTVVPIEVSPIAFMNLTFKWEPSEIFLAGVTFKNSVGIGKFVGKFKASAAPSAASSSRSSDSNSTYSTQQDTQALAAGDSGPDPGDTGTGTGTQT